MSDTQGSVASIVQNFDLNWWSGIGRNKDDTLVILDFFNKEEDNLELNEGEDKKAECV